MLTTTIKWRKWPEEKPPKGSWYVLVILPVEISEARWDENNARFRNGLDGSGIHPDSVTHFALPEDITTQDAAPSLGGKRGEL